MELAAVFGLSLLGGYFFAAWWRLTSYATRRYEGHHLYFRAALCGVVFFFAGSDASNDRVSSRRHSWAVGRQTR